MKLYLTNCIINLKMLQGSPHERCHTGKLLAEQTILPLLVSEFEAPLIPCPSGGAGSMLGPHKQSSEQDVEKTELFQASDAKWNSNTGHKEIGI